MARIPSFIAGAHIADALRLVGRETIPKQNRSRGYCLVERGRHFPPKYTISRAHEMAKGWPLPTSEFYGGQDSNEFLRCRGFRVDECTCGGQRGDTAATPKEMGAGSGRDLLPHGDESHCDGRSGKAGSDVQHLVALLSDPERAEDPRTFPRDPDAAKSAGLYSWWADSTAQKLFGKAGLQVGGSRGRQNGEELVLIYVGQTGAASRRKKKPSRATLADRVKGNHIGGNVKSSTFRETISAVLLAPLGLTVVESRKLARSDNTRVSEWVKDHLLVVVVPFGDRDSLERVEDAVLQELDPPFNLRGRPQNRFAKRVEALRNALRVDKNAYKAR